MKIAVLFGGTSGEVGESLEINIHEEGESSYGFLSGMFFARALHTWGFAKRAD